jgi:S-adenosylmethionine:tRNA ribosyltransferase-isomerase
MNMTNESLNNLLALYDYDFPAELIANEPAQPRDSARLLVFDRCRGMARHAPTDDHTGKTSFDIFASITDYLPKNAVLVFNRTKVIPARIHLMKNTGGAIDALYLERIDTVIRVMASGKIATGDQLTWQDGHTFTVKERDGKYALLSPSFPLTDLYRLLDLYGETPLPPYIKDSPLSESDRRREYQTVYAKDAGSVAAPTAGLHFTPELIEKIQAHGCSIAYVTLHVNLGTFAPLTEEHLQQKKLHQEYFEIDADTAGFLNQAKAEGRPIIAVGTTSVRTLESATVDHQLTILSGITDIFIDEDDRLHFVDGLITNFHVPRSSLLMLVSAFTGREKLLDLYKQAIDKQFRLFSFGDGMLIL